MLEERVDILSEAVMDKADAVCITTNGTITKQNKLGMGAGVAKLFRDCIPGLDTELADLVNQHGNHVVVSGQEISHADKHIHIVTFPVKRHWADQARYSLVEESAHELVEITNMRKWKCVYLPRPGCGNGGLVWETVKKIIEPILDDRFVICYL